MGLLTLFGGAPAGPGTPDPGHAGAQATGQQKTTVIRLQTLDGVWETVGVDRLRGVWPENDTYKADEWGPSTCSFDLKRDPGAIFPDLAAWTPVEVEIGGVLVWSGRVQETPLAEAARVVNVQGRGWQHHLDDDQYRRTYLHAKLGEWRDARSFNGENLAGSGVDFTTAGQVSSDRGVITLGWQNATVLPAGAAVGVKLDLGERQAAASCAIELVGITGPANSGAYLIVRASPTQIASGLGVNDITSTTLAVIGTNANLYEGDFATPARYVTAFLWVPAGVTLNGDVMVKITGLMTATDPGYLFAGSSVSLLTASTIISDALDRATLLLSAERSGITATTFTFPEFASADRRSPREIIDAADSVHGYRKQVDVRRRMIFEPKPSVPHIEIGSWPGSEFDDSSANDGSAIYNHVSVEGVGADGAPLSIQRSAAQQPGVSFVPVTSPAPSNPSFAADTAGWTPSSPSTITRDTTTFDSGPASGRWDRGGAGLAYGDTLTTTFTGTFAADKAYLAYVGLRASVPMLIQLLMLDASGAAVGSAHVSVGTSFARLSVGWTQKQASSAMTLQLANSWGFLDPVIFWVDSLTLATALPTLVDRRGFRRSHTLPVKNSLTPELGQQIADVWLAAHRTTPLKGTVKITGTRATRVIVTGAGVPPEHLLLMTGELLRLSHRIDPDSGGQGRDGRIAEVTYTPAADTALVALDSRRTSHEALLERLAVVIGAG